MVENNNINHKNSCYDLIVSEVSRLLDDSAYYNAMAQTVNPYGDCLACKRIIEFIKL